MRVSSPEEIAAWLAGEIHTPMTHWEAASPHSRSMKLVMRRAIFRLCPEAPDYGALVTDLTWIMLLTTVDYACMDETDAVAHVERAVAQLWEQSGAMAAIRGEPE